MTYNTFAVYVSLQEHLDDQTIIDELIEENIEEPTQSLPPSDVEAFSLSPISSADGNEECVAVQMPAEQGPRDSEMLGESAFVQCN